MRIVQPGLMRGKRADRLATLLLVALLVVLCLAVFRGIYSLT